MVSDNCLLTNVFFLNLFTADSSADHKLKWDMFKLSDLECYDSMMFRMFKLEMEALITRHETYRYLIRINKKRYSYLIFSFVVHRRALNAEYHRRLMQQQQEDQR